MGNQGVDGQFSLFGSGSVEGFIVEVWEEGLFSEEKLHDQENKTDASGMYSIRYSSRERPQLIIRLYDKVHRLIEETHLPGVTDTILIHDITKLSINAHGWLVTMDSIAPLFLSDGNQVTFLTDNELAWRELTADVAAATGSVHFSQLHFEVTYMVTVFVPDPPVIGVPTPGVGLEREMADAAARGVEVQVLMNDFMFLGYPADTFFWVRNVFANTPVWVKGFERVLLQGPMHAKIAVIDNTTGYTIGSPLMQEYFDGPKHLIDEPRRGEMAFGFNAIRVPIHDVSTKLKGSAAQDLDVLFNWLWWRLPSPVLPALHPATGVGSSVQFAVTIPGFTLPGFQEGATGILEAYQRAIGNAEDFLYFENQYFTEDTIVESLIRAIRNKPLLQVIMLLNPKVDLPGYGSRLLGALGPWQDQAIARLLNELKPDQLARLGLYSLWSHEITGGKSRMIRNYVHSKVAIADDKWATVGSANLDGVSLLTSQYILPKIGTYKLMRAIEMNAVFYNGVDNQTASDDPDLLRRILWAEHLGLSGPNDPLLTARPAEGWLKLWEDTSRERAVKLKANPPQSHSARILRGPFYVPNTDDLANGIVPVPGALRIMSKEDAFLYRCGIDPILHTVEDEVRSFDFSTGQWM
jgi:phosphatidylserine/phosphatidylglycerophosphate/cardiolipin synthase-like enzyme